MIAIEIENRSDAVVDETGAAKVARQVLAAEGVSEGELVEFCKARIAAYKYPRIVEFVDEVPKTPTGKFLRRALRGNS